MDFNEYEQSLIKCQYMAAVCDQLLNQLETKALAKILQQNRLKLEQHPQKQLKKFDRIQSEFQQLSAKMNKEYQKKLKHLDAQIKDQIQLIKKLKIQISLIKQSRFEGERNNRLNIRKIKQVSQLELQSVQLRKLLNIQLQNLNSLEVSNIEINEANQKYEKKEMELKLKIKKAMEKQKQYFRCKDIQEQYQTLFLTKRKLVNQNKSFGQKKHEQVLQKITAIAQASQNLNEMNRYENQLGLMIKEKKFMIQEIQKREDLHIIHKKNDLEQENDSEIFQEEINNLRKTIANRKFQQRAKSIHTSNKLEDFLNNSTPKNSIHYRKNEEKISKKKPQYESIFKIQIEPISHFKNSQKFQNEKDFQQQHLKQRKSMPAQISKKPISQNPIKPSQFQKQYLSQNKLPDFDTIEIEALERIIKNKQSKMKQAIERISILSQFNTSPINEFKNSQESPLRRENDRNKKMMISEPIEPKYKSSQTTISRKQLNNLNLTPNSRFIEQIIESTNGQHLERLRNNVRIRTKRTESQKYRHLEELQQRKRMQQQKIKKLESKDLKIASSKTDQGTIQHKQKISSKNASLVQNYNKQGELSFTSEYDNEFMSIYQRENKSQMKEHRLKYKDKIESYSNEKARIESVLQKIDELKKVKKEHKHTQKAQQQLEKEIKEMQVQKKQMKDKIKIFKLPTSKRKYGNGNSLSRKGKAEGMQDFNSDQQTEILPKIEEEQESIRNTLQSIPQVQ